MTTPEPITIDLHGQSVRVVSTRPHTDAFWAKTDASRWETDTFEFIDRHVNRQTAFLDVGGWIGPITLYAAARAGAVLTLEPDPVAWADISRNVALNDTGNVTLWHKALSLEPGTLTLFSAGGSGDSETSAIGGPDAQAVTVETVTFGQVEAALPAGPLAVKVDIEGFEYQLFEPLLDLVVRRRAPLHLSMHPRSVFNDHRRCKGWLKARTETFEATWALIQRLQAAGKVAFSDHPKALTKGELFRMIVVRGRPKNFSLEVMPD